MNPSKAAIIITGIIISAVLIMCMCWLGAAIVMDSDDLNYEPVPGSDPVVYEWR